MRLVRSDRDGDAIYEFVKEQMARYNLDEELLEALAELLDTDKRHCVAIEPSVREFLANADALSTQLVVFRHGGEVDGERAIPFVEYSPALMKVITHMRDILEMNVRKSTNAGSNGKKS